MKTILFLSKNISPCIKYKFVLALILLNTVLSFSQSINQIKTVTKNSVSCGVIDVELKVQGSNPISRPLNVVLVIDISGSMGFPIIGDINTPLDYAKDAADSFIDKILLNDNPTGKNKIAIVTYSTTATIEKGLTLYSVANLNNLHNTISSLIANGSTNIQDGLAKADEELTLNGVFDCSTARSIVLLTDGVANRIGTSGTSCTSGTGGSCIQNAITTATNAKTTIVGGTTYNNQIFSIGLFGSISGSDQTNAEYTLNNIQSSGAFFTESGANLLPIYAQISTQLSWVASQITGTPFTTETINSNFNVVPSSITVSKGSYTQSGQVISWNIDFLNSETITLKYQLTPKPSICSNQSVSTSLLNYLNSSCLTSSQVANTPSYCVLCPPTLTKGNIDTCYRSVTLAEKAAEDATTILNNCNETLTKTTSTIGSCEATITVTASNGCTANNSVSYTTKIDSILPVITTTAGALNHTIECSNTAAIESALTEVPTATDNCSATPTIHLVSDVTTPTTNCTSGYSRVRTWNFTDGCGNTSADFVQTITIIDTTAPVVTTTADSLNHTIECNNTAAIESALTEVPTATDNCSTTPIIHLMSDVTTPTTNCDNGYSRVRTWNFTDGCGNTSADFVQTITVIDNTAPVVTTSSGTLDHSIQCDNTAAIASALTEVPTASDNCSTTPTMHLVSDVTTPDYNCANAYSRVRTWNFTDGCGNTSSNFVQTITVIDTTAPVVTTTSGTLDHNIQCSDTAAIASALTEVPTATDNCSTTPTIHLVSDVTTPTTNCANGYSRVRTWNFTDGCGNTSANFVQTITVIDNTAPVIVTTSGALSHTIECSNTTAIESALTEVPTATDNCSASPTMHLVSDVTSPDSNCANAYSRVRTWNFTDACGNVSETFTQTITIQDTTAPTFIAPTDITLSSGTNCYTDISTATTGEVTEIRDNCDSIPTASFIDSDCFGNFNSASVNSGTGNYFPFNVSGFDNVSANAIRKVALAFETNQGKGRAEFILVAPNGQGIVLVAPYCNGGDCDNLTSNEKELYLPEFYPNNSNYPKWDNNNPIATNSIQNFTPNGILSTSNSITGLNSLVSSFEEFTGNLNGNWFIFARKDGNENGKIDFKSVCLTPSNNICGNNKVIVRKWSVSDACSNTIVFNQIIKIIDTTVPTWTTAVGSLNTTVECSDTLALANAQNLFPIATDNCDADLSNIVKVAGTFVASSTCSNAGTYTNTWTVTDDCGNTSETFTQTITIQDTTVPDIATKATDIIVECDGQGNQNAIANWLANNGGAIAFDNCSEVIWTNNFNSIANDCSTAVTVVFTATDACGNSASTSATFSVQDNTPPVVPVAPATITVGCASDIPAMIPLTARDNCSGNITIEGTNSIELGDCENTYTINRTWTFTDACNNISSTSQIIHVIDTTSPTIAPLPEPTKINCPNTPVFTEAFATDECGSNVNLTFKDVKTEGSCAGSYSITRTWTATDTCGNSSTASQTINVEDKTGPITTTMFNSNISTNCDAIPVKPELVFVDGCSAINSTIFTETISNQTTDSYIINRKWAVSDTCGNTSEFVQTVNVTITNSIITLRGSVCNDGGTTSIDLNSLFPTGTPTTGTWTDFSNTGKLEGNNFNAANLAVGDYIFDYTINDTNCPRSIRITVTVTTDCGGIVLPCGTIVVHNAFSPNGDGINEKFVIDNINDTNCYPENTVEIYNRWGVLVYSTKGYNNTTNAFDGISDGRSTVSQSSGLPAGTYFYILTYTSFDNNNNIQNNKKLGYLFLTK